MRRIVTYPRTNSRARLVPGPAGTLRLLAAGALVAIAVVHLLDLPSKLDETPYLAVLYVIGPVLTSLLAAALIVGSWRRIGWLLGGAIAAATAIGYCLSRTTGLPHADDDIGNWSEPLGIASLIAEGIVVLLAAGYLIARVRAATARQSPAAPSTDAEQGPGALLAEVRRKPRQHAAS